MLGKALLLLPESGTYKVYLIICSLYLRPNIITIPVVRPIANII